MTAAVAGAALAAAAYTSGALPADSEIWLSLSAAFGLDLRLPPVLVHSWKNAHFLLDTAQGRFLARRCRADKSLDDIAFEVDLIEHLAASGFPGPRILRTTDGRPWHLCGTDVFVLSREAPGVPQQSPGNEHVREVGRTLAAYHLAVDGYRPAIPGPHRPTYRSRLSESVRLIEDYAALSSGPSRGRADVPALVPEEMRTQLRYTLDVARDLLVTAEASAAESPDVVIHGGCRRGSALFEGPSLSCMLDFDSARWEQRPVDIAIAVHDFARVHGEAKAHSSDGLDLSVVGTFMAGYQEVRPVDEGEVAMAFTYLVLRRLDRALRKVRRVPAGLAYRDKDAELLTTENGRVRWLLQARTPLHRALSGEAVRGAEAR